MNDPEAAMDLLEPLFKTITVSLVRNALNDPDLDILRELPRFKKMAEEARLRTGSDSGP